MDEGGAAAGAAENRPVDLDEDLQAPFEPADCGLSAYRARVGKDDWEALVAEETWRAVRGILGPARKPPRGVRTPLGGLARCQCGNVVSGMPSHTGRYIYRCFRQIRHASITDPHVARQSRAGGGVHRANADRPATSPGCRRPGHGAGGWAGCGGVVEDASAIPRNLEEMAADRALNLIMRTQMISATERGNARLAEIEGELSEAARENVLAPLVAAENAAEVWESLDLSGKRAIIKTLMTITLLSPGKGTHRAFGPSHRTDHLASAAELTAPLPLGRRASRLLRRETLHPDAASEARAKALGVYVWPLTHADFPVVHESGASWVVVSCIVDHVATRIDLELASRSSLGCPITDSSLRRTLSRTVNLTASS